MNARCIALCACLLISHGALAVEPSPKEAVILLHGLARTTASMEKMDEALTAAGYSVYVLKYPTTEKTVQQLSDEYLAPLVAQCATTHPARIHFVAHSLGGIVLRHYLSSNNVAHIGRIVMLGPPNQGSEVVDKLGHYSLFEWINGPAGNQLGTDTNALPNLLPVPTADVGIIAGTRSINLFLSTLIPGPDDGKVAIERTKLDGMDDFAAVPVAHPFLMENKEVIELTLTFLRHGNFGREVRDE